MQTTFRTVLWQDGNNTGIEVPEQNLSELGAGKRVPVEVTVNGYSYKSTTAFMGGKTLIPFAKAHRDASGIQGGDAIEVTLTRDESSRAVELPDDARQAAESAGVLASFEKLAPSHQKEYVRSIEEAKKPETRANRIQKMIDNLAR
ncbi:MAG: DUF1905 domain-containing protein [Thermomicrobiales bacterium]|nr:DUF1905 domain-containing protein [Thermomicrobiales bacterium]